MSSAGTVPAWVIAKQQKAIERQQEAQRKLRVRAELTKVADRVRQGSCASTPRNIAPGRKMNLSSLSTRLNQCRRVDADVDFVLHRLHTAEAMVGQISALHST